MDSILRNTQPYPAEILALNTFDGFYERWLQHKQKSRYDVEAYEKTEAEYKKLFGKNHFTSYNAFRMAVARKVG